MGGGCRLDGRCWPEHKSCFIPWPCVVLSMRQSNNSFLFNAINSLYQDAARGARETPLPLMTHVTDGKGRSIYGQPLRRFTPGEKVRGESRRQIFPFSRQSYCCADRWRMGLSRGLKEQGSAADRRFAASFSVFSTISSRGRPLLM